MLRLAKVELGQLMIKTCRKHLASMSTSVPYNLDDREEPRQSSLYLTAEHITFVFKLLYTDTGTFSSV